jgi:hypothetical protein
MVIVSVIKFFFPLFFDVISLNFVPLNLLVYKSSYAQTVI